MAYYCYILECQDGTFYTGWTKDPQRRTKTHNTGKGARYTRSRRPVELVYLEELPDHISALKREIAIKKMNRSTKIKLIANCTLDTSIESPSETEEDC